MTVMPELVHWQSQTENGGRTTIIPSTADAVALGASIIDSMKEKLAAWNNQGVEKVEVNVFYRHNGKTRTKKQAFSKYAQKWEEEFAKYEQAVKEITLGNPDIKHEVAETATKLMHLALDLQPSIASAYNGFERWEDGDEVLPDLLRAGDDRPFLRRKRGELAPKAGKGDGAYRIIINTDVAWWGTPAMNAGVMGALVMLLQQFAPVEIWIQQGWLGIDEDDGVSLFKLDFAGNFDATQLSFWCGSPYKDTPFSYFVSRALGRQHNKTSVHPELPCDLYLRGDWMTLSGVDKGFDKKTKAEQEQLAAQWIARMCSQMVFGEEAELQL
jgi:hypothetical protein